MTRSAALMALGIVLSAMTQSASAASVEVMVVGPAGLLKAPTRVRPAERTISVAGRRCAVGAATPLAALLTLRLPLEIRDYGSCGRSSHDAAGLFVRRVGGYRNRGQNGWVYKVGRKAGTAGAADPSGSFGDGRRLRDGQRVVWFWCVLDAAEQRCQPTLEISPARRRARPGEALRVRVRGFDDSGRGGAVPGATVSLGEARATTGAGGFASIAVPRQESGTAELTAEKPGAIRSFPTEIAIG